MTKKDKMKKNKTSPYGIIVISLTGVVLIISIVIFLVEEILGIDVIDVVNDSDIYTPEFTYSEYGDGENEESSETEILNRIDYDNNYSLIDAMPFYSYAFSVVYRDQLDTFYVDINPASSVTTEQVVQWFASFEDVKNVNALQIVFNDQQTYSAPVE